jgi:hypothetical protein
MEGSSVGVAPPKGTGRNRSKFAIIPAKGFETL